MSKMIRKYILLFMSIFLVLCLSACRQTEELSSSQSVDEADNQTAQEQYEETESEADVILPDISENYWELFDTHCDIVYEPGFMATNGVQFTLLSAFPIHDVTTADQDGNTLLHYLSPFHGLDEELTPDVLSEPLFLLYQGVPAEDIFHSTGANNNLWEVLQVYRATDPNELPALYWYILEIMVDWETDAPLTDVVVTIGEESKRYAIGSISNRMNEPVDYPYDPEFALDCNDNLTYFNHHLNPNSGGITKITDVHYTANKDLTLTGLYFYRGADIVVGDISIVVTTVDGITIDTSWDGNTPFPLSAEEIISLNMTVTDPFFSDSLGGTAARYLMLEYSVDEQTFELGIPFYFHQTANQPFVYIASVDGLDIASYYEALNH